MHRTTQIEHSNFYLFDFLFETKSAHENEFWSIERIIENNITKKINA